MRGDGFRSFQALVEPKTDWGLDRCQDRFAMRRVPGGLRVALSDGATQSCQPRAWADLLAQASVGPLPLLDAWGCKAWQPRLRGLSALWKEAAAARLPSPPPWFSVNAMERGAYATLLQLEVSGRHWWARAVGDSCLFQVRRGRINRSFPLQEPEAFNRHPALLATRLERNPRRFDFVRKAEGCLLPGDQLLLATDALACRLLALGDAQALLDHLEGDPEVRFRAWVQEERTAARLKDDDTTLLIIGS